MTQPCVHMLSPSLSPLCTRLAPRSTIPDPYMHGLAENAVCFVAGIYAVYSIQIVLSNENKTTAERKVDQSRMRPLKKKVSKGSHGPRRNRRTSTWCITLARCSWPAAPGRAASRRRGCRAASTRSCSCKRGIRSFAFSGENVNLLPSSSDTARLPSSQ